MWYVWSGMYRDVHIYPESCILCEQRKLSRQRFSAEIVPLNCPVDPFIRVGIDFYGLRPKSSMVHRWVVAIDHLNYYVEVPSLHTASATEVAYLFLKITLRHGAPPLLLSLRGTTFISVLIKEVLSAWNIVHSVTSSYHPQTNGLTERFTHMVKYGVWWVGAKKQTTERLPQLFLSPPLTPQYQGLTMYWNICLKGRCYSDNHNTEYCRWTNPEQYGQVRQERVTQVVANQVTVDTTACNVHKIHYEIIIQGVSAHGNVIPVG